MDLVLATPATAVQMTLAAVLVGLVLLLAGCGGQSPESPSSRSTPSPAPGKSSARPSPASLTVTSSAFADGQPIPRRYSCHGANQPPPLALAGVPDDAAELALVVDDPDAVGGRYVHWVVVGIDPATTEIADKAPTGSTEIPNSGGEPGYLGPCPPRGTGVHHYRFTLYVLTEPLRLGTDTPATRALTVIRDAAVARHILTGTFRG